jgi:hypothetical protein
MIADTGGAGRTGAPAAAKRSSRQLRVSYSLCLGALALQPTFAPRSAGRCVCVLCVLDDGRKLSLIWNQRKGPEHRADDARRFLYTRKPHNLTLDPLLLHQRGWEG